MPPDRITVEKWLDAETQRLLATIDTFRGRDASEPSTLPDWSLGQLLTHIARNADALCNLLHWARTGIETPMYRSTEQRNDDINRGALRSTEAIIDDVAATAEKFHASLRSLPTERLDRPVRTAQGRTITAAEIPWLRLREVVVHHVDLGAHFERLPAPLIGALLVEVSATLQAKPQWPSIAMVATDSGFSIENGEPIVIGRSAQLLSWLTGRSKGRDLAVSSGGLAALPAWL